MKCHYACGSAEHTYARREFLGQITAGCLAAGGAGAFASPLAAASLAKQHKRVLLFFMSGGLSQLESWDPKPATPTGGPFRAIPSSVPGVHVSELLPNTAKIMDHLMLVRGVNTSENDHGAGHHMMLTGRRRSPAEEYPRLGSVVAKALHTDQLELPGFIRITPSGAGGRGADSAYLGPKYASVALGNGEPPANTTLAEGLTAPIDEQRHALRQQLSGHFLARRRTAQTDAYMQSYDQANTLMRRREAFDISKEPEKDQERYGKYDLGRHCLLARRLLEQGALFVQVTHSNYDTHCDNFNFHIEQVGEFDRSFATTIQDLKDRGMLDSTLVIVLSEFGRSPRINGHFGRDHWSKAWSIAMAGCGVQVGGVFGKTNDHGTEVAEGQVNHGQLFHTYLNAVGIDSSDSFDIGGRPIPIADPAHGPVSELLA